MKEAARASADAVAHRHHKELSHHEKEKLKEAEQARAAEAAAHQMRPELEVCDSTSLLPRSASGRTYLVATLRLRRTRRRATPGNVTQHALRAPSPLPQGLKPVRVRVLVKHGTSAWGNRPAREQRQLEIRENVVDGQPSMSSVFWLVHVLSINQGAWGPCLTSTVIMYWAPFRTHLHAHVPHSAHPPTRPTRSSRRTKPKWRCWLTH